MGALGLWPGGHWGVVPELGDRLGRRAGFTARVPQGDDRAVGPADSLFSFFLPLFLFFAFASNVTPGYPRCEDGISPSPTPG